jgi:hypothetical protein
MDKRVFIGLFALASWLATATPSMAAATDSIITVSRTGSANDASVFLTVGGRLAPVEGCTGGGCGECTADACSWGLPAGSEATLTVNSWEGFVDKIDADCIQGLNTGSAAPGVGQATCTLRTRPGPTAITVRVDRPTIRLSVEGPTTAEVLDPHRATDPKVLAVAEGTGTVAVPRGTVVSFRQTAKTDVPGRVSLDGFSGDCVSDKWWCNMTIDKPSVSVTAKATVQPLIP